MSKFYIIGTQKIIIQIWNYMTYVLFYVDYLHLFYLFLTTFYDYIENIIIPTYFFYE